MKKILLILPFLFCSSAFAGDNAKEITRLENYLSSLTTLVADFNQVSPDGSLATGKFYLKRPGKMRWQYNPPTPIVLVSDGKTVTYFDAELDQISYVPLDSTLAGFLTQPKIKMDSAATKLVSFSDKNGIVRATIIQRSKPDEGSLTLEMTKNPIQLKQMKITDATGSTTSIQLQNAMFGTPLQDSMFIFTDPRGNKRRSRR